MSTRSASTPCGRRARPRTQRSSCASRRASRPTRSRSAERRLDSRLRRASDERTLAQASGDVSVAGYARCFREGGSMSAEVQDLAIRYGAAWADRDVDAVTAMHTEGTVYHLHGGGDPAVGLAATREAFAAALAPS